jgi:molybdate transport system regulatory protein
MPMSEKKVVSIGLLLHIHLPNGARLDAADLALIELIRTKHSITIASHILGFSYRNCQQRVGALNKAFREPVIATFPGRHSGGAEVTSFGERLLNLCRSVEDCVLRLAEGPAQEIVTSSNMKFGLQPNSQKQAKMGS